MSADSQNRWAKSARIALATTLCCQSILLLLILTGISFPAPNFLLSPIQETLQKKGLVLSCDSARFNFRGTVVAQGLVIRTAHPQAPTLLKVKEVKLKLHPLRLLTGSNFVRSIKVEGASALFKGKEAKQALVTEIAFSLQNFDEKSFASASGWLGKTPLYFDAEIAPVTLLAKGKKKKVPFFFPYSFGPLFRSVLH